jgi:hypothetical protein
MAHNFQVKYYWSPEIPLNILDVILPKKDISVLDFLNFSLPGIARESPNLVLQPQTFFSTQTVTTTDPRKIQQIPLPPISILEHLLQATERQNAQSIVCQHVPGLTGLHFPLWIVTYWDEAARTWTVKNTWILAEAEMELQMKEKNQTEEAKDLITRVSNALAIISWSATVQGFLGAVSVECLATYMTKDWLTDEHENQMLHLLGRELERSSEGEGIYIADTFFVPSLIRTYKIPDRVNQYGTASNCNWLRKKGQEFGTGALDKLATIANVGGNHWVAVVIDFRLSQILYGDSLGGTITAEIEMVLNWWVHHHTFERFTTNRLPITCQRDDYSCGILAWNAVATKVLPKNYTLIKSEGVADERLKMFLRVSERHNDKVGVAFEN